MSNSKSQSNKTLTGADRRYLGRFWFAMSAYAVLLVAGILLAKAAGPSAWRFAAMALPAPAIVAIVLAVAKYAVEADEMQSVDLTRSLAIAFGAGSAITFTYGMMQVVGAPALNWMFVWMIYAACWILASAFVKRSRS